MDPLLNHLGPFLMVVMRLGGALLAAPIVASAAIPIQVRTLLTFALALAVYPTLPAPQQSPITLDLFSLTGAAAGEVAIGFVIGLLALLPITSVQLSGLLMGQQLGFGLASVYNPAVEADTDLLGELLLYVALGVYITIGGVEAVYLALCHTFQRIPIGGFGAGNAPLDVLVGVIGSGFELALRVSLPLMAIVLMETVATSFLSKTMPQLNVLSVGFAVKIVLGFVAILAGLHAMQSVIGEHVGEIGRRMLLWSSGG